METITQEYIKKLFDYRDGILYWKVSKNRGMKGAPAGILDNSGYLRTRLDGKCYLNHRLIWLYFYGKMPTLTDHIDRNRLNNNIENLRDVSESCSRRNTGVSRNNLLGIKGVCKYRGRYIARIYVNSKQVYLGSSYKLEDIVAIRRNVEDYVFSCKMNENNNAKEEVI